MCVYAFIKSTQRVFAFYLTTRRMNYVKVIVCSASALETVTVPVPVYVVAPITTVPSKSYVAAVKYIELVPAPDVKSMVSSVVPPLLIRQLSVVVVAVDKSTPVMVTVHLMV